MAIETELKLQLHPTDTDTLLNHPLLQAVANSRVQQQLYNTYYDTPDCLLRQHKVALRVRRKGTQWLQTIKGGGSRQGGLHQRSEWEMAIDENQLDFTRFPAEALTGILGQASTREAIKPVFVTEFQRTTWQLSNEAGDKLELCLDQGKVNHENGTLPIHEVELELLAGNARYLYQIGLQLLAHLPLVIETGSKAQRGYQLMGLNHNDSDVSQGDIQDEALLFDAVMSQCIEQIHIHQISSQQGDVTAFSRFNTAFSVLHTLFTRYPSHPVAQVLASDCEQLQQQCQQLYGQQQLNGLLALDLQHKIELKALFKTKIFNRFLLQVGEITAC